MEKCVSEKHKSWCMKDSWVTLPRTAPFWVQLESGEHVVVQWYSWKRWGLLHGMYGSMEAELQRNIKRAELTAFRCLVKKVIGPKKIHADNKGIFDGL